MAKKNTAPDKLPLFGDIVFPSVNIKNKAVAYTNYVAADINRTIRFSKWKGTGIGEDITPSYPEKLLQTYGYFVAFNHNGRKYITMAGLGGELNEEYFPRKAIIDNPYIPFSGELEIGKDCVVVKNDSYMLGLARIYGRYEARRIENEITLYNLNVKMRDMTPMSASDDKTFNSIKKYLDDLEEGKFASIAESAFWEDLKIHSGGVNYSNITQQLIEYEQYIKASRDNFVGLNGNFNMKREAITASESDLNEDGLFPTIMDMTECRKEGIEQLNSVLGWDWSVEMCGPWKMREEEQKTMIDQMEEMREGGAEDGLDENEGSMDGVDGDGDTVASDSGDIEREG